MSQSDATLVERVRADLKDDMETLRERPWWVTVRNTVETPVMFFVYARAFVHAIVADELRDGETIDLDSEVTFHLTPRSPVRDAPFDADLIGRVLCCMIAVGLWVVYGSGGGTHAVQTGGRAAARTVSTGFTAPPVVREIAIANWLILAADPLFIITRWFDE